MITDGSGPNGSSSNLHNRVDRPSVSLRGDGRGDLCFEVHQFRFCCAGLCTGRRPLFYDVQQDEARWAKLSGRATCLRRLESVRHRGAGGTTAVLAILLYLHLSAWLLSLSSVSEPRSLPSGRSSIRSTRQPGTGRSCPKTGGCSGANGSIRTPSRPGSMPWRCWCFLYPPCAQHALSESSLLARPVSGQERATP